jgi:hypothetical protein
MVGRFYDLDTLPKETVDRVLSTAADVWDKDGGRIITELSDVAGLPWQEDKIPCYLVSDCFYSFSDPLTVPLSKHSPEEPGFVDIVSHELIHRLLHSNEDCLKDVKQFVKQTFPDIKPKTEVHLILYGIQSQAWQNLFGDERRQNLIATVPEIKSYQKAWQMVQEIGYEKVVDEFRKKLRI